MFQLSKDEFQALRSHFGTLKRGEHSKYLPYAFTEHGAIMLASVLNTQTAVEASIYVVRAFEGNGHSCRVVQKTCRV